MAHLMDGFVDNFGQRQLTRLRPWLVAATGTIMLACGGSEQSENPSSGGATAGGSESGAGATTGGSKALGGQTSSASSSGTTAIATGGSSNIATGGMGGMGGMVSGGTTSSSSSKGGQSSGGVATGGQASGGVAGALPSGGTAGKSAGGTVGTGATGGKAVAGQAGTQATGGKATAGAAGATSCAAATQTKSSRAARSAGFTGTYQANYYPLYSAPCTTNANCQAACVTAGGTTTSCASSECIDSTPDYCLPPTFWFDLDRLRIESNTIEDSAWITMVNNPYRDQLIISDFQFEIPSNATVNGISFSLNRSADSVNMVADYEVKLMRGTSTVGLDRALTTPWAATMQYANYGGGSDLWGTTWTPANINASTFGLALTPMYLDTGGNARAYVDFVRATVSYTVPCN